MPHYCFQLKPKNCPTKTKVYIQLLYTDDTIYKDVTFNGDLEIDIQTFH